MSISIDEHTIGTTNNLSITSNERSSIIERPLHSRRHIMVSAPSPAPVPEESCPFCAIAATYPPQSPSQSQSTTTSSQPGTNIESTSPLTIAPEITAEAAAHLILSTKHVLAFLDIMPLTRGHVLLVTRDHFDKLEEMGVCVSREVSNA